MVLCVAAMAMVAGAQTLSSPDGRLTANVQLKDGCICYSIQMNGQTLLEEGRAALNCGGKAAKPKFSRVTSKREVITAPHYRQAEFTAEWKEMRATLGDGLAVTFRMFNDGLAYRFETSKKSLIIKDETAQWELPETAPTWMAFSTNKKKPFEMAFQNVYSAKPFGEQPSEMAFLPVTIDLGAAKMTILEADVEAYPGVFVCKDGSKLKANFAAYPKEMGKHPWRGMSFVSEREDYIAKTSAPRSFPWRVMAITTDDRQMPVCNLVYALAAPSRIGDASWVKWGKVSWDWWNDWNIRGVDFEAGINTATYRYMIDFAAQFGLPYIILDEGWYDSNKADLMNPIPEVDLPELIAYGKQKSVGIILWTVFNVLDEHLDEACAKYSAMGVKGFKVDFLDRNDQTASEMIYRIAETAARYHLTLDLHGTYPPSGYDRTFPNIINVESLFGMEEVKWAVPGTDMPLYDVTFPFIRMMTGPVDYTPGAMRNGTQKTFKAVYNQPMSMGTRAHQVATYVVHDSPLTMLADAPSAYLLEPEVTRFIASIPDVVRETRILQGRMGESIVTARRYADGSWAVGAMTNWEARDITISFDFLPAGKTFTATLLCDGLNADRNAEDYKIESFPVTSETKKTIRLASGGGAAVMVKG